MLQRCCGARRREASSRPPALTVPEPQLLRQLLPGGELQLLLVFLWGGQSVSGSGAAHLQAGSPLQARGSL